MSASALHHVTAIAGPARRNLHFYTRTLGLRLVKKTVNFDDPSTYHFYFGDGAGAPGTILTFFPWEHAAPGRLGVGETMETSFRIPEGALGFWTQRLVEAGVRHEAPESRFGDKILSFQDPDGTRLALVAQPGIDNEPAWSDGAVPPEHAIRGFFGVGLLLRDAAPTAAILEDVFGYKASGRDGAVTRYKADGATMGAIVDLRAAGEFPRGRPGAGSVHHIAFRASDDAAQADMVRRLADHHGVTTTEQKDRNYFRSVYFREPGGVLFEIATDDPGFAVDEPAEALGTSLKLPPGFEAERKHIEAVLPPLG
jgi:glyoxalase family protein